jgi:polyisoprenyl-phosphate glycosyltransferase
MTMLECLRFGKPEGLFPAKASQTNMEEPIMSSGLVSNSHVLVLIPVFGDWKVADLLIQQLDRVFGEADLEGEIIFVDDGSLDGAPNNFPSTEPRNFKRIQVLELRKNVGHQRALCAGLVAAHENNSGSAVVVMDADGEDSPSEVPRLLQEFAKEGQQKVIFAERGRRAEGIAFKIFYQLYRILHRALVGFDIRVGNFSILQSSHLERLVVSSELWNHYAAAVIKSRVPWTTVRVDRAKRLYGQSKMGFIGLVVHGLSAMSVFGETVGTRLLMVFSGFGVLSLALICLTIGIRVATKLAIPGWATYTAGLLLLLLFQSVTLTLVFTFVVLNSRSQSNFIPMRDCSYFIRGLRTVFSRHV